MNFKSKNPMIIKAEQFLDTTESIHKICQMFSDCDIRVNYKDKKNPTMIISIDGKIIELEVTDWIVIFPIEWIDRINKIKVLKDEKFKETFEVIE